MTPKRFKELREKRKHYCLGSFEQEVWGLAEERLLLEQLCERREGLEIFPPAGEDPDDFWVIQSEDLETEIGAKTLSEAIRKAAVVSDD